jgi:hypothetical protein
MPKRAKIIMRIAKAAKAAEMTFEIKREGANHTIYSLDGLTIPLGRHNEFGERYAEMIYKRASQNWERGGGNEDLPCERQPRRPLLAGAYP